MNKSVLTAAVLAATSFGALADAPTFYGRLNLSLSHTQTGATIYSGTSGVDIGENGTYLENNSSKVGLKGSETLAEGIKVVYKMEFGVNNTSNTANDSAKVFSARNTYLGIKTAAGTVLVGRNDSVFKNAEGQVDIFGTTNADIAGLVSGQKRPADGIWYYSPKIADLLTLNATYLLKDNQTSDDSQYALSATMGDKELKILHYYLAAAYNKGIGSVDAYRGVAQMKLGDVKLGALYQNSESVKHPNMEGNSYFVNLAYKLGGINLKAEYGWDGAGLGGYFKKLGKVGADTSDVSISQITLGADTRISKSTKIYGHYAMYEGDYKLAGVTQTLPDDNIITLGVRYDF